MELKPLYLITYCELLGTMFKFSLSKIKYLFQITVSLAQGRNINKKEIYVAIILSWGVSTILQNATHLPYMLERGEQKIGTVVKSTLQTAFDCNIKQFTFTQVISVQLVEHYFKSIRLIYKNTGFNCIDHHVLFLPSWHACAYPGVLA